MATALAMYGANAASYEEALARIEQFNLPETHGLATLHLMALAVAGCTADGQLALANVAAYALDKLDADAHTAKTGVFVSTLQEGAANGQASCEYACMHLTRKVRVPSAASGGPSITTT